jgi:CRISPR-associated protein Cas1
MRDMQLLPKLSDSISFLYLEQVIIHRNQNTIEAIDKEGRIPIPVASLSTLLLGPGVSISHAAINIIAKNGCSVVWVGEDGTRFYASGMGETYKAYKKMHQAEMVSDPDKRKRVVLKMYYKRFSTQLDSNLTLPQIRGLEGVRVRKCYQEWSEKSGVEWRGRNYNFQEWGGDPINRGLSTANAVMNAVCTTVIISAGYSTALGFIHQGRQYSFVYDVADLYKTEITIPTAFSVVGEASVSVEKRVRFMMREKLREGKLMERILGDIESLLGDEAKKDEDQEEFIDPDQMYPFPLWDELFDKEGGEK